MHQGRLGVCLCAVGLLAMGCSAELEHYTTDADTGSTHALVSVERSKTVDGAERAGAVASFVRIPAEADANALLEVVGLRRGRPPVGQCRSAQTRPTSPPLSSLGRVELVEAGDVVVTANGSETSLAPHAFPTVTDLVSGVVYTTRDLSSDPLPADEPYTVRATGIGETGALTISRQAPPELEAVTLGGLPLAEVSDISLAAPVDLTWSVGAPGDVVVVELTSSDGAALAVCSFRDDTGAGTVPVGTFDVPGSGRLSLHRVRTSEFSAGDVDLGELRFDFEVAANVSFTP